MQPLTYTEENYIKAIYAIAEGGEAGAASVNEIAERMQTRPATVTDMLRKLSEKSLIHYEKYKKVQLTGEGRGLALSVIRRHRLWETFLHKTLNFSWDEVHEVAEQLEHIQSQQLVARLDDFLGFPDFDPHGDPIPKSNGELPVSSAITLAKAEIGAKCKVVAVKDTSATFLQQLAGYDLHIGSRLTVQERQPYDGSLTVVMDKKKTLHFSEKIAENLMVIAG